MNHEETSEKFLCFPKELCSVLVIDDDPEHLELMRISLKKAGFDVLLTDSASRSLEIIMEKLPDIILLDIMMPEISGIVILEKIRQNEKTAKIPVILVSALDDTPHVVQGLHAGANDYVTKPINFPVLIARMKTHLRIGRLLKRLETQTHVLSQMAAFDDLTGSYNRRAMIQILDLELNRSNRYGHFLSILMMDIDHFKKVNDEYGHLTGDQVLREFTYRINDLLRTNDTLCRFGGEEFVAILPETPEGNAVRVGQRICSSICNKPFVINDITIYITVSIGVFSHSPRMERSLEDLLKQADTALYKAKNMGRNCFYFLKEQEFVE